MTYKNGHKDRCVYCNKLLEYSIAEDIFIFCDCQEKKQEGVAKYQIPPSKDNKSSADAFEIDIQRVIDSYCNQGLTSGAIIGALQNRIFNLSLNIHLPSILEVLKREMKK